MTSMKNILFNTIQENKGRAILLVVIIFCVVAVTLAPPQLLRLIIDNNLNNSTTKGLGTLVALYLLALLLIGFLDFLKGWLLTSLGQRVICKTRGAMLQKLEKIPLGYFTKNSSGSITSRFTTDTESINTLFADGIISMVIDCLKIIGIVISIAIFSAGLAMTVLILIPIIFGVTRLFQKNMLKAQTANLEQLGLVSNHVSESVKNVQMIKIYYKENYMENLFCQRLRENYRTKQTVNLFDSCYAPSIQILRAIAVTIVVLLSSEHLHVLGISAGMLAASIELLRNLLSPIESLGMELQSIQQGISGIRRIDQFIALPEESKDNNLTAADIIGPHGNVQVRLENVSFAYDQGAEVLQDISFTAEPHTSVTLAGRTGVGKTTLMNLMLGLLTPQQGAVYINNTPAKAIPDQEKRLIFGHVEQNFQFIPGSISQQITLGDPKISQSQVIEACKFTGLHETIINQPQGYATVIENGSEFSQGQRQLLAIARAIVTNPPVLLLDEITANLDSTTEDKVVSVLNRACENRTIISISHRSTSIVNCDYLVMLENGKIIAQGAPAQILA